MQSKDHYLKIEIKDSQGNTVSLNNYLGSYLVLYFYPKDDTPGCTTEACSFRDANDVMTEMGVKVIGISKDSPESHRNFIEKHHLNFELLSDENGKLLEAFDAIGEKKMFGKTFMGIKRSTVILNKQGEVIKHYKTVKPKEHTGQVLNFLKQTI